VKDGVSLLSGGEWWVRRYIGAGGGASPCLGLGLPAAGWDEIELPAFGSDGLLDCVMMRDTVILPPGDGAAGDLWGAIGMVKRTCCWKGAIVAAER